MEIYFVSFHNNPEAFLNDASFRYRCENLAFALNQLGISAKLQHFKSFKITPNISYVIFHRPRYSPRLKRLVKRLQKTSVITIADFDDLVFDESFAQFSPAVLNNILPLKKVITKYRRHFQAMRLFESISVSTVPLAQYAKRLFPEKNVSVLANTTHHSWLFEPPQPASANDERKITYFPGTRSHDRDFWQIEDAISTFLDRHPSVNLLVIGPLKSDIFNRQGNQVQHVQRLPFADYTKAVSSTWVNLLPLEPTPFNQCKSALKVIEGATYHAPTICSPLPDALRFEDLGAIIAIDQSQWLNHLERLMDPDFYNKTVSTIKAKFQKTAEPTLMAQQFCCIHNIQTD